jgi:tetrahydromethanopterin S-methyltransferase subunit B
MTDSTAIGLAMIGCAFFSFFIGLGLVGMIALIINLVIESIKEAIKNRKDSNNNDR